MATATASNAAQTGTRQLYSRLFQQPDTTGSVVAPPNAKTAIAYAMLHLCEGYEKKLGVKTVELYQAALMDLTVPQLLQAFSRATEECKYWPSPATLRELAGVPAHGDPVAAEAKAELFRILTAMRGPHGLKLQPILGRILYGTEDDPKDADGVRCAYYVAPKAESTVFRLDRRPEAALVRLGWGSREAGIALIAEHPALNRQPDQGDEKYKTNQLRAADEILKRWTDAYREV